MIQQILAVLTALLLCGGLLAFLWYCAPSASARLKLAGLSVYKKDILSLLGAESASKLTCTERAALEQLLLKTDHAILQMEDLISKKQYEAACFHAEHLLDELAIETAAFNGK